MLKITLIRSNDHAIKKEFLCMSTTRYKFISVVQGRHVRSTNYACEIVFKCNEEVQFMPVGEVLYNL